MGTDAKIECGWGPDMPQSLHDKLKEDLKTAMRARNTAVRDAIRQVMAEFPRLTVPLTLESGKKTTRPKTAEEITNDDILGVIQGLVKSEKMVLEARKEKTSAYLETLNAYLPQMADREEIAAWIKENIDFSRYKSRMQAMGTIMKHFGKRADGRQVNQVLRQWPVGGK